MAVSRSSSVSCCCWGRVGDASEGGMNWGDTVPQGAPLCVNAFRMAAPGTVSRHFTSLFARKKGGLAMANAQTTAKRLVIRGGGLVLLVFSFKGPQTASAQYPP